MAEIPERADMLRDVESHMLALARLMPMGPPSWAHHDLTFGQLRLLFLLRESAPVSIGQLADKLGVTDATASEFVDRVERRGLAVRTHRADDRRVVECRLSDDGLRLLAEIAGARRDGMRQVLSVLGPEELAQFDRLLVLIAERLPATLSSPANQPVNAEGEDAVDSVIPATSPSPSAGGGGPA
jgi:DNA-binding MarR family transcriptional regulator